MLWLASHSDTIDPEQKIARTPQLPSMATVLMLSKRFAPDGAVVGVVSIVSKGIVPSGAFQMNLTRVMEVSVVKAMTFTVVPNGTSMPWKSDVTQYPDGGAMVGEQEEEWIAEAGGITTA